MRLQVVRTLALLAGLCPPTVAHAGVVVLSPFLADPTVTPKLQGGLHQLIASELDFSAGVESVVELKAIPPSLNDACLRNQACLAAITQQNAGNQMLAGRMSVAGASLTLDMVFFDGRQIAHQKQFVVPSDASGMANAMTPIIQEMLSGKGAGPGPVVSAVASVPDLEDDPVMADQIAAPAPVTNFAPPPPPVPVPLPPPVPVPAPAVAVIDPSQITFKTTAADLSADQINSMIRFGPPSGGAPPAPQPLVMQPPPPPPAPAPAPVRNNGTKIAEEEAELDNLDRTAELADLDGGRGNRNGGSGPTRTPGPSGSSTGTIAERLGHSVQFTGRGGFSKYYTFNFVTGGAEFGVAATGGLHFIGGVEVFAVQRVLPPAVADATQVYSEWDLIYPGNVGLIYKYPIGIAQPYIGADAIFVQYYKDKVGADWAGGARLRAGIDIMFVRNFGLNINLAAGGWYGQNWPLIDPTTGSGGFLPQASGGTVLAF